MASYYGGSDLSAEQVAQIAYQAGFRGEQLVEMVAIAKRESSYNTGAHRTDSPRSALSGDRGLWQINYIWDNELTQAGIIRSKADLFDPATNARAAMYVFQKQGAAAWLAGNGGTAGLDAARGAVNRAQQSGALGSDWQSGASGGSTASGSTTAKTTLPSDATIVRYTGDGGLYAVFDYAPNQGIWFQITDETAAAGHTVHTMDPNQWYSRWGTSINGGDAAELTPVASTYGTFGAFWSSIATQVIGPNNPAINDPGVLAVLAEFAARPDMSEVELQNKLKGTAYWQARTEGELQWNSLSQAEQALRRQDAGARMAQTWFEYAGVEVTPGDMVATGYVELVASGKMGFSEWTETVLKPRALDIAESPWSRQVRTEEEAQRQRPIDIENTVSKVRDTLQRWGLQWTEPQMHSWAKAIVEKHNSDDDLMEAVKDQAQAMFVTKPRDVETQAWAGPWLQTYGRVMEEEATLFTPEVVQSLAGGHGVWDLEQSLKKSSKWLNTRNAREELFTLAGEVGARMGYA